MNDKVYTKETEYGSNGRVYAGMFYPNTPNPFPQSSDDVADIQNGYRFETGSYIYVVQTGKVFMYNAKTSDWVEQ